MKELERERLLDRSNRGSTRVGKSIPEQITVQGDEVELREFVFETKRLDTVPERERERIERMKEQLKRERLQRRQRIENDDISYERGERLVAGIVGIDRALTALDSLEPTALEDETREARIDEEKRWMDFLRQIL
jgi:hypothetical protein